MKSLESYHSFPFSCPRNIEKNFAKVSVYAINSKKVCKKVRYKKSRK